MRGCSNQDLSSLLHSINPTIQTDPVKKVLVGLFVENVVLGVVFVVVEVVVAFEKTMVRRKKGFEYRHKMLIKKNVFQVWKIA